MTENEIAKEVVDAAYQIHHAFGPGLLESAYSALLAAELQARGLEFRRETAVPIEWRGTIVDVAFRADFIVGEKVILELRRPRSWSRCTSGNY